MCALGSVCLPLASSYIANSEGSFSPLLYCCPVSHATFSPPPASSILDVVFSCRILDIVTLATLRSTTIKVVRLLLNSLLYNYLNISNTSIILEGFYVCQGHINSHLDVDF